MCGPGLWSPQESHRGSWFPRQHRFPNGVLHSAQGLPTRQGPKSHLGCTPATCSCTGNCVLQTVFVPEDSTLLRRQSYRQHQPIKGPRVLSFRLSQCLFFGGTYTDTGAHREACQKSHSKNNAPPPKKAVFPYLCAPSRVWMDELTVGLCLRQKLLLVGHPFPRGVGRPPSAMDRRRPGLSEKHLGCGLLV